MIVSTYCISMQEAVIVQIKGFKYVLCAQGPDTVPIVAQQDFSNLMKNSSSKPTKQFIQTVTGFMKRLSSHYQLFIS